MDEKRKIKADPMTDEGLAQIIQLEYFERWAEALGKTTEEKKGYEDSTKLCRQYFGVKEDSKLAMLFAAFSAGMAAGMDIADRIQQAGAEKKKGE